MESKEQQKQWKMYKRMLQEMKNHVDDTVDEIIEVLDNDENPNLDRFMAKIEFNGKKFILDDSADTYDALERFVDNMIYDLNLLD